MECLGCRIANGIEPNLIIVFENEHITCVLDIAPFHEGHTLILPKKHYWDVDDGAENRLSRTRADLRKAFCEI